ncbi:MAG: hypothetical protein ACWA44_12890 [Thiotrichales bacterium]
MTQLLTLLFPEQPRVFRGARWGNIVLRTLHLVGVAGMAGGYIFGLDESRWLAFGYLTLVTGVTLVALYLASTCTWLMQLKGLAIAIKLVLLALALWFPFLRPPLFIGVIIISGVIAHAPGSVRGYLWLPAFRRSHQLVGCRIEPK